MAKEEQVKTESPFGTRIKGSIPNSFGLIGEDGSRHGMRMKPAASTGVSTPNHSFCNELLSGLQFLSLGVPLPVALRLTARRP